MSDGVTTLIRANDQSCNDVDKHNGNQSTSKGDSQQNTENVTPNVPEGFVEKIAEEVYGLKINKYSELDSFEDKNYHIIVSPTSSNPHVTSVPPEGYVLKVMNSVDTQESAILYAQIDFMRHLSSRGITTQEPIPSTQGENVVFYPFPSKTGDKVKTHAVCLRTFIPGSALFDVTLTPDLCYKVGKYLASISIALQDFRHPFYDKVDRRWSLNNVPKVTELVHVISDVRHRHVIDDVIAQFASGVLPRRSEIRSGIIFGDPNANNIIVKKDGSSYKVAGVVDYADAANTHPLYDLAINIAYVATLAITFDPLEVGGHIIAGYTSVLELPDVERSLLRVCVAARLVQSLVVCAHAYSLHPSNEYLLATAKRGWHVLHSLWDTPAETLYELWDKIQRSYTADS